MKNFLSILVSVFLAIGVMYSATYLFYATLIGLVWPFNQPQSAIHVWSVQCQYEYQDLPLGAPSFGPPYVCRQSPLKVVFFLLVFLVIYAAIRIVIAKLKRTNVSNKQR